MALPPASARPACSHSTARCAVARMSGASAWPSAGDAQSRQILAEVRQRAIPGKVRGLLVVARRGIVVEAVLRAFVGEGLIRNTSNLQRRLKRRARRVDAFIRAGIL